MSKVVCITNNPLFRGMYFGVEFVNGMSWDVFVRARDLVHQGWKFLGHPLYGNFNPMKQPYRTLLLQEAGQTRQKTYQLDMPSIEMLENALAACRKGDYQAAAADNLPEAAKGDFALLDKALMEETLGAYLRRADGDVEKFVKEEGHEA